MANVSNKQMLDGDAGGSVVAPPVKKPKWTFTPEETSSINTAATEAGEYFTGTQQDYIDRLRAGDEGGGANTLNALNTLISQGKEKYPILPAPPVETDAEKAARLFREQQQAQYNETKAGIATDAYARLKALLSEVGLSGLEKNVQDLIARGVTDGNSILFELRDTAEFKERFKGNIARKAAGLPELAPLVYVALEKSYRDLLKANGFNADVYNDKEDYAKLIGGDVSLAELQVRVEEGYNAVDQADPEVIRQMEELYKVSKADLAHYFLDPSKTAPQLKQQAKAAGISARAKEQGKIQLSAITAEELVSRGYTDSQAQQAFTILSEGAGLYSEMAGETGLTEGQKIGSAFGYDTNSKQAIQKRASLRKAGMVSNSKFTSSTGASTGTIETGLNVAQ